MFTIFNSFSTRSSKNNKIQLITIQVTPLTTLFNTFTNTISGNTGSTAFQNGRYIVTESGQFDYNWSGYQAFNNTTGDKLFYITPNNTFSNGVYIGSVTTNILNSSSISGEWLQIALPYALVLNSYTLSYLKIYEIANMTSWYILGSNDGSTWNILDYKSLPSTYWTSGATVPLLFTTNVTNTIAYMYYRTIPIKNGGAAYAGIAGLNFIGLK